jgi:hypothetical protein
MLIPRNRTALAIVMIAGAFGVAAIAAARHEPTHRADLTRPITRAEAESLLAQTVRLAQSGDVHGVCESIAASKGTCEGLLQTRYQPGKLAPTVAGFDSYHAGPSQATAVLSLEGVRDDGSTYTSDFAVIRAEPDRLAGMTPIYWSGVLFVRDPAPLTLSSPR